MPVYFSRIGCCAYTIFAWFPRNLNSDSPVHTNSIFLCSTNWFNLTPKLFVLVMFGSSASKPVGVHDWNSVKLLCLVPMTACGYFLHEINAHTVLIWNARLFYPLSKRKEKTLPVYTFPLHLKRTGTITGHCPTDSSLGMLLMALVDSAVRKRGGATFYWCPGWVFLSKATYIVVDALRRKLIAIYLVQCSAHNIKYLSNKPLNSMFVFSKIVMFGSDNSLWIFLAWN